MKLFYLEPCDIMCIKDGKEIWKYVGDFAPQYIKRSVPVVGEWFQAQVDPESSEDFWYLGRIYIKKSKHGPGPI